MKELPILFSGPMVRAILDGRKTQTRRVVTFPKSAGEHDCRMRDPMDGAPADPPWPCRLGGNGRYNKLACPYGAPGDRLWVRETYRLFDSNSECACYDECRCARHHGKPVYRASADDPAYEVKWTPSIHMPRWASRITLEIVSVRVERVQEISEDNAKAEGIRSVRFDKNGYDVGFEWSAHQDATDTARESFKNLWDSINAKRGYGWDANPWVWVVEFKRLEGGAE